MKNVLKTTLIGFIAGLLGAYVVYVYAIRPELRTADAEQPQFNTVRLDGGSSYTAPSSTSSSPDLSVDFSSAAARATPSVVFINSISQGVSYSYWDWFFGESGNRQQVSSGSGVIFTQDGYIITNNHVVASAERIEVNYNKRMYPARLIGTDPSTDLAVIKIEENNLPAISLGSSKNLQVGEWVIAVGNPYTLSSTVTAGIVSAKGRRIGILEDKFPIESFIQTDAAINPGNSGGALVNRNGELVGINSAILSRTGSYTGYAFAIPIDIARKVFDDLVKYGVSQKAFYGGNVIEYNYENAKKYSLDTDVKNYNGVLLESVERDGPAYKAGLVPGDIITKVNGHTVNTQSEFEEEIAYLRPGDVVNIDYLHKNKQSSASIKLVNRNGASEVIKRRIEFSSKLGAQLEATEYGVKVFNMKDNSQLKEIGVPENFTIIAINRMRIKDPDDVNKFFEEYKGRGYIYGVNSSKQQVEIPFILR